MTLLIGKKDLLKTRLWRYAPKLGGGYAKDVTAVMPVIEKHHVFPSGRSALIQALRLLGLSRNSLVALPPYSSTCVIAAIGKVATPLPFLHETLSFSLSAILIYEQWGWPVTSLALARLQEAYPEIAVILDCVDTPFPGIPVDDSWPLSKYKEPAYRIWSFGKTLGTLGGGLLTRSGELCEYNTSEEITNLLDINFENRSNYPVEKDYQINMFRNYSHIPSDDVLKLLDDGNLELQLEQEIEVRRDNARFIAKTIGTNCWRPWMFDALRSGAAPGIAPLFLGQSREFLQAKSEEWASRCGIETTIYHFNVSGDPMSPEYMSCLAVPLHGDVPMDALKKAINLKSKKRDCKNAVVIGGGIAGIFASRMLPDIYNKVSVIETGKQLGGLMRSVSMTDELSVDFGTHVPMTMGHVDIDRMLFENMTDIECNRMNRSLREGIFHNNKLDLESGCLDADLLPTDLRDKALREIIKSSKSTQHESKNLQERLLTEYGQTLTDELFNPVIKQLTNHELQELSSEVLDTFHLTRVRILDSDTATLLKAIPELDKKIAYRKTSDGKSSILKLYPKKGGAGKWIQQLVSTAKDRGVRFITEVMVKDIIRKDAKIKAIELSNGGCIDCDLLIWSAPPVSYLRLINEKVQSAPPVIFDMIFVHLILDMPFIYDLDYLCCYEPGYLTYRATFYNALTGMNNKEGIHASTAEIIVTDEDLPTLKSEPELCSRILNEYKDMGLISKNASIKKSHIERSKKVLPIQTPESQYAFKKQVEVSKKSASNLLMIGRNNHKHGLNDVLQDVYQQITSYSHH